MEKTQHPINGSAGEPPAPEPAAAPPEPKQIAFDPRVQADMEHLVRVAFAEKFASFRRTLRAADSIWVWHRASNIEDPTAEASEPVELGGLPRVSNSGYALCEYADQYCLHLTESGDKVYEYVWCVQRLSSRQALPFQCLIVRVLNGQGDVLARAHSDDPAVAIASAMLHLVGIDYPQLHRELFPEQYQADDRPTIEPAKIVTL